MDLEQAYQEACMALGEAIVRERAANRYIIQLEAALEAARQPEESPAPEAE